MAERARPDAPEAGGGPRLGCRGQRRRPRSVPRRRPRPAPSPAPGPTPGSRPGRTRTSPGRWPRAACGRVDGTTLPACVSTTVARAARSWSASQLDGSNAARSARNAVIERMTSGGSSRPRRNSSTSIPLAASSASQPPSTSTSPAHRSARSAAAQAATMAPNPWPARTTRSRGSRQQPGSFGRGEHIAREGRRVVALGRGVGQPVAAQVHRDDAPEGAQAASHRGPRPGRVRQPVDEQHARCVGHVGRIRRGFDRATPVEEVDPVAGCDLDDEAVGFGCEVRRRQRLHRP